MADTKRTIDKITKARERLLLAIEGLTEEQMTWSPDGEWSIQEILQHVGIAERANVELAKRALAGNPVAMDNFDLDSWNVEQVSQLELEQKQETSRQKTLERLQGLADEDLSMTLEHPGWGEMTIQQLFRALGTHDLLHRRDILKRIDQLET